MDKEHPETELILERLRLLDNLLNTKLTEEQIKVLIDWCKSN